MTGAVLFAVAAEETMATLMWDSGPTETLNEVVEIACPCCNGRGDHPGRPYQVRGVDCEVRDRCGHCDGSGRVEACVECRGTGCTADGADDCPRCDGSAYTPKGECPAPVETRADYE